MKLKPLLRSWLPRSIHSQRILTGPLRGYRIVTCWHDYPAAILGYTERPLLAWFAANVRPGETWLDIGAHYGYTAIALSRLVGAQGRVFAFEPMLSTAGYLTQTRLLNRLPQLMVLPLALAMPESMKMEQLPVTRGMVDSTLRDEGRQKDEAWRETILVARFDWLWQRICGNDWRVHGIKIDVQGMEIEVLHGMVETLRCNRPKLVLEVHHGVDRNELVGIIESLGYSRQAVPIEPITEESEPHYVDDRSYAFHPA